jgi:hypothetical protein
MNLNTGGWASPLLRLLARLRSDGVNSTTPVTEINGGTISAANADIALVAKGTGATLAQVPDGTVLNGDKRGTGATDWQKSRLFNFSVASGLNSTIAGGTGNTASGSRSAVGGGSGNSASSNSGFVGGGDSNSASGTFNTTVCGGSTNTASAQLSFVGGGGTNTASSNYSFIGGGQSNNATTGTHATVCGGQTNTASSNHTFIGSGQNNNCSGSYGVVIGGFSNGASGQNTFVGGGSSNSVQQQWACIVGGRDNLANSEHSFVSGGRHGTTRSIVGYHVFPACLNPVAIASGATQSGLLLLGRQTTDATATVLASNSSAAATTNQVTLPDNSAYSFSGEVIAGVTGAGNAARWTIDGAIKRGANAASTVMVGTPTVTMTHFDAGAATWVVAVTANTTLGCITVTVTGAAATTIRWVCRIDTTEMTF